MRVEILVKIPPEHWYARWEDGHGVVHWVETVRNARVFSTCKTLVADRSKPLSGYPGYATTKLPPTCLFCIAEANENEFYALGF